MKTILVVEDNAIAARINKVLLEHLGCQVDCVENGSDAVKKTLENHYDGISMDIGLPILSGLEACLAIRKHEKEHHLPLVPIIAVTGNNSEEEIKAYLEAGMQAVIEKPLDKEKAEYLLSFCK